MKTVHIVLLPGMDGTGRLFAPYLRVDPHASIISYPADKALGYDELEVLVRENLPETPFLLLGESFSGPLAIQIAARPPPSLRGLVLVSTFARNPTPLPNTTPAPALLFRRPLPLLAIRALLVDDPALAFAVREATRTIPPDVMAHRLRCVLRVDVRQQLASCTLPVLSLFGLRDRLVPRRCADEIASLAPRGRHVALDTPHLLLQTAPELAAREIARLIEV